MRFHLCCEQVEGEACMAHVVELPGCFVLAPDLEPALDLLPDVIERHRIWLRGHGISIPYADDLELVVQQVVEGPRPWDPNGASALFESDRLPLTEEEVEDRLRLLACARADLLALVHRAPRGAYDEQAPGVARTLRGTLNHLAEMETWFISRIGRHAEVDEIDPLRRLVDVRARSLEQLARAARGESDWIFVPTVCPSDDPEEAWTLRKLFRRLIEHELEHLDDVRDCVDRWINGPGQE